MLVKAYLKYLRISPKKIKEVAKSTVGLSPKKALEKLSFQETKASKIVYQVVKSALANATNNLKFNADILRIKSIEVGKGPILKRWRAVSRGRAHSIKKPTSHVKIVLQEIEEDKKLSVQKEEHAKKDAQK